MLAVLRSVILETRGRVKHLTSAEAERITKVHAVAPDLDPWQQYRLARAYILRSVQHDQPTDDLDALLAFAPWRSTEARKCYDDARAAGYVRSLPLYLAVGTAIESGGKHPLHHRRRL